MDMWASSLSPCFFAAEDTGDRHCSCNDIAFCALVNQSEVSRAGYAEKAARCDTLVTDSLWRLAKHRALRQFSQLSHVISTNTTMATSAVYITEKCTKPIIPLCNPFVPAYLSCLSLSPTLPTHRATRTRHSPARLYPWPMTRDHDPWPITRDPWPVTQHLFNSSILNKVCAWLPFWSIALYNNVQ